MSCRVFLLEPFYDLYLECEAEPSKICVCVHVEKCRTFSVVSNFTFIHALDESSYLRKNAVTKCSDLVIKRCEIEKKILVCKMVKVPYIRSMDYTKKETHVFKCKYFLNKIGFRRQK